MTDSRAVALPVALLVGAGDAIGAAVARRFAASGLQVCVARRDAAKAKALIDEVAASGGTLRAFSVDARQEDAVQDLFAKVEREMGPIEVCLYNAGSNVNVPLVETSESLFRKAWELACYGGFLTGREAARYMVPRGRGTILFTGATASVRGGAGFAAFASAKFGLRAVAQSMARELGPKNIHVAHLLVDGGVDSEAIRKRMRARIGEAVDSLPPNTLIQTKAIAEAYWALHVQPAYGWTHELDLRTAIERW
jgi:NAD(P)-dependent dehydrogenase (short-subunit alcohol dehydrogenase family)